MSPIPAWRCGLHSSSTLAVQWWWTGPSLFLPLVARGYVFAQAKKKIPAKYFMFDSWWYQKDGDPPPGTATHPWPVTPALFNSLTKRQVQIPLQKVGTY